MDPRLIYIPVLVAYDVDNTQTDTQASAINQALYEVQLETGILDSYFFTSMYSNQIDLDIKSDAKYTRPKIQESVHTTHKINVPLVVTPFDTLIEQPGGYFNRWMDTYIKCEKIAKDSEDKKEERIGALCQTLDKPFEDKQREIRQAEIENTKKGIEVKVHPYEANKPGMAELLVNHFRVGSIFYADDLIGELVEVTKSMEKRGIPITTFQPNIRNVQNNQPSDIPIVKVEADFYPFIKEEIKQRIRGKWVEHFNKLPPEVYRMLSFEQQQLIEQMKVRFENVKNQTEDHKHLHDLNI